MFLRQICYLRLVDLGVVELLVLFGTKVDLLVVLCSESGILVKVEVVLPFGGEEFLVTVLV